MSPADILRLSAELAVMQEAIAQRGTPAADWELVMLQRRAQQLEDATRHPADDNYHGQDAPVSWWLFVAAVIAILAGAVWTFWG